MPQSLFLTTPAALEYLLYDNVPGALAVCSNASELVFAIKTIRIPFSRPWTNRPQICANASELVFYHQDVMKYLWLPGSKQKCIKFCFNLFRRFGIPYF
jgi:hypothetical protein